MSALSHVTQMSSPLHLCSHLCFRHPTWDFGQWRLGEHMLRAPMHMPELCACCTSVQTPMGWILQHMRGVNGTPSISAHFTSQQLPQQTEVWTKFSQWRMCIDKALLSAVALKYPQKTYNIWPASCSWPVWLYISYMVSCCSSSSITNEHAPTHRRLPRESPVEGKKSSSLLAQRWTMKYTPLQYAENNGHSCNFFFSLAC